MRHSTLVVVTSALFIGPKGERLTQPSPHRLKRLYNTMYSASAHYGQIVVLDNTLPMGFTLPGVEFAELGAAAVLYPTEEFQLNGPSRLEAVLLAQTLPYLQARFGDFTHVLKLSAGYEVKNLAAILPKADSGLVFRMGNPFRSKIKFCLTSFYILPTAHYTALCAYFVQHLNDMSKQKPLEYYLYRYVQQVEHRLLAAPYPVIDADFLSSGRKASDLDYRLKEVVFRIIAKFGFYAYQFKG